MLSLVNSHSMATSRRKHRWEIDLRFDTGLPAGWYLASITGFVPEGGADSVPLKVENGVFQPALKVLGVRASRVTLKILQVLYQPLPVEVTGGDQFFHGQLTREASDPGVARQPLLLSKSGRLTALNFTDSLEIPSQILLVNAPVDHSLKSTFVVRDNKTDFRGSALHT
jgi:hypothetical protein